MQNAGLMTNASYSLKDESGATVAMVEGSFEAGDTTTLRNFVTAMANVRGTELLSRGLPAITNMKLNEQGLVFTCAPYKNSELHELLHVLRPVVLSEEATSFDKISALLKRRFADKVFSSQLKRLRRVFEHGEFSLYMEFGVGGRSLFHRSTLDTWLNGTQYHTDAEKAKAWASLEKTLDVESTRALVMNQIHSRVKALFMLEGVVVVVLQQLQNG